jgi:hypothetical protein
MNPKREKYAPITAELASHVSSNLSRHLESIRDNALTAAELLLTVQKDRITPMDRVEVNGHMEDAERAVRQLALLETVREQIDGKVDRAGS